MPTLQDVAKRAGVSTATVSKVLSNTPYFTEETRAKVMQAVDALGYRPNLAARALSTGKTRVIAVVFPYVYEAVFTDPHTLRILEGIEAVTSQQGYNLLLSTPRLTTDGPDELYLQLIQSGFVDGVLALDNIPITSVLDVVHQRGLPCVGIGHHSTTYYVHSDNYAGGLQLMQHVIELGHRHIGIISISENINLAINLRVAGLRAAAEAAGMCYDDLPLVCGDFSTFSGGRGAAELLMQHPQLTALVCMNDRMAMGAIQQARALGRQVPDDLTVVGYDDIPTAAIFAPALTTVDQHAPEMGRVAAQMLFDILNNKTPDTVKMATHLIVRQSSAAPQ
jgi:DNA-binding LacI/PurR family transcriptional regulator